MMYDGKTDVFTNVEINGKMLVGIDSDNNDRFLFNRQENPIGILTLDAGNDDTYNGPDFVNAPPKLKLVF